MLAQAKHPCTRAALDTPASGISKDPAIEHNQVRNHGTASQGLYTTPPGGVRAEPILLGSTPNRQLDAPLHPHSNRDASAENDGTNGDSHL